MRRSSTLIVLEKSLSIRIVFSSVIARLLEPGFYCVAEENWSSATKSRDFFGECGIDNRDSVRDEICYINFTLQVSGKLESICRRTSVSEENSLADTTTAMADKPNEYASLLGAPLVKLVQVARSRVRSSILKDGTTMSFLFDSNDTLAT